MIDDNYSVMLQFDPQDLETTDKIQSRLIRLKRLEPERLRVILSKGKIVIKRDVDRETAQLISQLFQDIGATCWIEKQSTRKANTMAVKDPGHSDRNGSDITCPRCKHRQPQSKECRLCGFLIGKAKNHQDERENYEENLLIENDLSPHSDALSEEAGPRESILPYLLKWLWVPFKLVDLRRWNRQTRNAALRCGINFSIAFGLEIGLLYLFQSLWSLYHLTPLGQQYTTIFIDETEMITRLFSLDPVLLGLRITLFILVVCLALGVMAQFFHLIRYLYESRGIFGKWLLWFLPVIAGTAWLLSRHDPWPHFNFACLLVFIPVLCLLTGCLYLARKMVPELGDIMGVIGQFLKKIAGRLRIGSKNEQDMVDEMQDIQEEE